GVDDRPTALPANGYAKISYQYDSRGQVAGSAFWGLDRDGAFLRGERRWEKLEGEVHAHKVAVHYAEDVFLTADGKPARHKDGYHKVRVQLDGKGREVKREWFGADGKPAVHRGGYVREEWNGVFGPDGELTRHADGYFAWTARYDARGLRTEEAYFDKDG